MSELSELELAAAAPEAPQAADAVPEVPEVPEETTAAPLHGDGPSAESEAPQPEPADAPAPALGSLDEDCGQCDACLDKVKFGGTGRKRKGCFVRAAAHDAMINKPPKATKAAEPLAGASSEGQSRGTGGAAATAAPEAPPPPPPPYVNIFEDVPIFLERGARARSKPRELPEPAPAPARAPIPPGGAPKLEVGTRVRIAVGPNAGKLGAIKTPRNPKGYYTIAMMGGERASADAAATLAPHTTPRAIPGMRPRHAIVLNRIGVFCVDWCLCVRATGGLTRMDAWRGQVAR